MNILVTGAAGFAGSHLARKLRALQGVNVFEYDIGNSHAELEAWCRESDFVFHLAGVNRPKDTSEFWSVNAEFTDTLLGLLSHQPFMLSSSVQAALTGRFGRSEYGMSKREAEELCFKYHAQTGAPVFVYRFPNLAGPGIRPNYNSAVGTFCYNIARDLPITVNDADVELELCFIDDMTDEMICALNGRPHRCFYDGMTPIYSEEGRFCAVPVTHKARLGYIVKCLREFHDDPSAIPEGDFERKLYSMYISYLPGKERD